MADSFTSRAEDQPLDPSPGQSGGYLAFRRMITPSFVRSLYVAGMLILTIAGLILIAQGLQLLDYGGRRMVVWGALALLPGNVLWRVLCEQIVILHRIHEELVTLEARTRHRFQARFDPDR